jgi:hypothetical protein
MIHRERRSRTLAGVSLVIGIPVYAAQRSKMTEPDPEPEYR